MSYSDQEEENQDEIYSQISLHNSEVILEDEAESLHEALSEAEKGEYEHVADPKSQYICFSGHEQGPEAYLTWERDMEDWFQHHHVSETEKPIIVEDILTKSAFWY